MISKKNKSLIAGVLAAASAATAIVPAMGSAESVPAPNSYAKGTATYAEAFSSLYDDVITNGQKNHYLSANTNGNSFGIPYHSVETLCIEAPDYGHETTSEAMSYIVWVAAMHDALVANNKITGSSDLAKAWKTLEAMIPGWSEASGRDDALYETFWTQTTIQSDVGPEMDSPEEYPITNTGAKTTNPLFKTFKTAYSGDRGYYLMHWLADVDDWYGFGKACGVNDGGFVFINTFQRGEEESCFETVPHPCLEELKAGNSQTGIKGIFNGANVAKQYAFTNAPDAEDRAIQAIIFGNKWGVDAGEISALAGKMGDQCRNDMFDKYYLPIGCQSISGTPSSAEGQHWLMAWYTSWGGALGKTAQDYTWAWQIGCSHSHQFYQNPLAAWGLITDKNIAQGMQASGAKEDYEKSLKRQIEMYMWLQSVDGPFAGGCTNSYRGRYEKYPSAAPTFYDMVYVPHPVYADPGSNHWIGNQVWPMQRLAELYYYVKQDPTAVNIKPGGLPLDEALDAVIGRWVEWFIKNTHFDYEYNGTHFDYCIPSTLDWGKDDKDNVSCAPDTWNGTYDPDGNQKLTCKIGGYGQGDIGCVSSLCETLMWYAKAKGVSADAAQNGGSTTPEKGLQLANKLLTYQWNLGRDDIGIAFKDHNGSLSRVFTQKVYIPTSYTGEMPDGSTLKNGATFISIRKNYENDPMFKELKAAWEASGETSAEGYEYKLHRFWHHGDALMAYGDMALLYPEVTWYGGGGGENPTDPTTGTTPKDGVWGDADQDGVVKMNDAVLIMQSLSNPDKFGLEGTESTHITSDGKYWGDVESNGNGITAKDALQIQKWLLKLVDTLDPTK